MQDNKRKLLQKMKALADQGVGGEKINAQRLLAGLIKKYGVTDADLDDEKPIPCEFKCKTDMEEKLLRQTIYKVTNETKMYGFTRCSSGRTIKHLVGCECTQAQKIEIEFLFDFYKRVYEKDAALFLEAFIQKHNIFGQLPEGEEPQEVELEKLRRMVTLQSGMSDETPQKQLTGGNKNGK